MIGPKVSYASLMDDVVMARAEEAQKTNRFFPLRPSAAGKCGRRLAHELAAYYGMEEPKHETRTPAVNRLLDFGHYIEEQAVSELADIPGFKLIFKQQVLNLFRLPISGKMVEGSTDAVMMSDDYKCVLDVKSVGDRFHGHAFSKWDGMLADYSKMKTVEVMAPNAFYVEDLAAFLEELGSEDSLYDNCLQVNSYACTEFLKERGIDHGVILRYLKNSSKLMEIRFKPSQVLFEKLKAKFIMIEEAVLKHKDPTLVPKDFAPGHIKCTYCPYKEQCWPTARRGDFYKKRPGKQWSVPVRDLEEGAELDALISRRLELDTLEKEVKKLDHKIILLADGHGVDKIKAEDGSVWEVKILKSGASLRRSKD